MSNVKVLEYPYTTTMKCSKCGKECEAQYLNHGILIKPNCDCLCQSENLSLSYKEWQTKVEQERQDMLNRLPDIIDSLLDNMNMLSKQSNGSYRHTFYVCYDDMIADDTVVSILSSSHPMENFYCTIEEFFWEERDDFFDDICRFLKKGLQEQYAEYAHLLPNDLDEWLYEYLLDKIYFIYPYEHYLKQEFKVPITVDTGDSNYDFVLNSVYPAYNADVDEPIDDSASLVWLAKQQGYTKEQLWNALLQGEVEYPNGFIESVVSEVANTHSGMNALTFLVKTTLEELLKINELIKSKNNGKIFINKGATCGLYDSWNGSGSNFDIQLEKGVELPISLIFQNVLPDIQTGNNGRYGIDYCFGFCGSVWEKGRILSIIKSENNNECEVKGA